MGFHRLHCYNFVYGFSLVALAVLVGPEPGPGLVAIVVEPVEAVVQLVASVGSVETVLQLVAGPATAVVELAAIVAGLVGTVEGLPLAEPVEPLVALVGSFAAAAAFVDFAVVPYVTTSVE